MSADPDIQLAQRAVRDLRRLDRSDLRRVRDGLDAVAAGSTGLDIKPLAGHAPWRRLRVGDFRVLYRELTAEEGGGWLVARVVNRRDLERAVRSLG
jgi:mRNA-degrading endonuclease RelE of RelBE toxin-antitoxin system